MIVKIGRQAFEEAVAAFVCAAGQCSQCDSAHDWQPIDAPDNMHELAVAAVRGAMSAVLNAAVFIEDEHALGLPCARS
jgi:hypothetical protein